MIWDVILIFTHSGSGIADPDPGVKNASDPGAGSATLPLTLFLWEGTAYYFCIIELFTRGREYVG